MNENKSQSRSPPKCFTSDAAGSTSYKTYLKPTMLTDMFFPHNNYYYQKHNMERASSRSPVKQHHVQISSRPILKKKKELNKLMVTYDGHWYTTSKEATRNYFFTHRENGINAVRRKENEKRIRGFNSQNNKTIGFSTR